MAGPLGPRHKYIYDSDDGFQYAVTLRQAIADAAGFAGTTTGDTYPRGWKMRRVYGVNQDGQRRYIPCPNPQQNPFATGQGTFSIDGDVYLITGAHGEHRPLA